METKNSLSPESQDSPAQTESPRIKIVPVPVWMKAIPFFLSGTLFLSGFFAWLAPFPLLLFRIRAPFWMAMLAFLSNAFLVRILAGPSSLSIYGIVVGVLMLTIPSLLERRVSVARTGMIAWVAVTLVALAAIATDSMLHGSTLLKQWSGQVDGMVQLLTQELPAESRFEFFGVSDAEEIKTIILREMPSGFLVVILAVIWANLTLLLNANPFGIRNGLGLGRDFFRNFKVSEYWVWPSIAFGIGWLLVPETALNGWVSVVSANGVRVMMALYLIQGISILSFFLDVWKIAGFFRWVVFGMVFAFMMPVIVTAGFFDLWFDFRSKLRQS
ncbi:MAG: DUF2232 domain-containing protein [Bdellovibrionales bacterium]|nr:DUF2232 domain-containing protein [Bdellovibrionales bacterium]